MLPRPNLILVAGPNGSGKTTITEKLLRHQWMDKCTYINPDIIAQQEFGDWNSRTATIQAADKAQQIREQCLRDKVSMACETVFSTSEKIDFVQRAITAGFFVRIFFICTNDPTINARRVALRVMEGGHDVPISKIISRYYKSIENCTKIISQVERTYIYDNSTTDSDPSLRFRASHGVITKTYGELLPWMQSIYAALKHN
jgi:predicted ABC-type ATPase